MLSFVLPESEKFFDVAKTIKEKYEGRKKELNVVTDNDELATLFEKANQHIKSLKLPENFSDEDFNKAVFGIWIHVLEKMTSQSWFSPEFKQGYVWNSGNILYSVIVAELEKLGVSKEMLQNQGFKFHCLEKLSTAFDASIDTYQLTEKTTSKSYKADIAAIAEMVLLGMKPKVTKLSKSIPSEEIFDEESKDFYWKYKKDKENTFYLWKNTDREFSAQWFQRFSQIHYPDKIVLIHGTPFTYSLALKVAAIAYLTKDIYSESKIFYVRSTLYKRGKNLLKINLDPIDEIEFLNLLKRYLQEKQNGVDIICEFEKYGRENFKDENHLINLATKFDKICKNIDAKIASLESKSMFSLGPISAALSALVTEFIKYGCYGTGATAGYFFSKTNYVTGQKLFVGEYLNKFGYLTLGDFGGHLGYGTSEAITEQVYQRAGGKMLEWAGGLLAEIGISALCFLAIDFTLGRAIQFGKWVLQVNEETHLLTPEEKILLESTIKMLPKMPNHPLSKEVEADINYVSGYKTPVLLPARP